MITKTNLTIIHDGKRVNVYTPEELKNTTLDDSCSIKVVSSKPGLSFVSVIAPP